MDIKIQKIKSDVLFKTKSLTNAENLNSDEELIINEIKNTLCSDNKNELLKNFEETDFSKKFLSLLIRVDDISFNIITNYLLSQNKFYNLNNLTMFFNEEIKENNEKVLINYMKILNVLNQLIKTVLLNSENIKNTDLENQSLILDKIFHISTKFNDFDNINYLFLTVKLICFKYSEIKASTKDKFKILISSIKVSLNQNISNSDGLENLDTNKIKLEIQNFLTKNEIKHENANLLSELTNLFMENKKLKEEKSVKLNQEKENLNYFSIIVEDFKLFENTKHNLKDEIRQLKKLIISFDSISIVNNKNDAINDLYNNLSEILTEYKKGTRKKIQLLLNEIININDKNIVININQNLDELQDIQVIFPELFYDKIKALYECFLKYMIIKNSEFSFSSKDCVINLNVDIKFDHTKIEILSNFNNKINSILHLYKILLLFPVKLLETFKIKFSFINGEITKSAENNIFYILAIIMKNSYEALKETIIVKGNVEYINSVRNFSEIINFVKYNFDIIKNYKFCDEDDVSIIINEENNDDKIILTIRDIIVTSFSDLKKNNIKSIETSKMILDMFFSSSENTNNNIEELKNFIKIHFKFSQKIYVSQTIENLILELVNLLLDNKIGELRKSDLIQKIVNILIHLYKIYIKNSEQNDKAILGNNLELLRIILSIIKNFYYKYLKTSLLTNILENINIFLRKFCTDILSEKIEFLLSEINELVMNFVSFESSSNNKSEYEDFLNKIITIISGHFNSWKYLLDKDFLYFFNYITTLIFDRICKMIIKVKSYSVDDCSVLSKILNSFKEKYIDVIINKNFSSNKLLCDESMNLFNSNMKVRKFEEIFLLLEANLKQVKNYIENTDEIISDKNELIDYIKSLFEDSSNRISVIKLIERKH